MTRVLFLHWPILGFKSQVHRLKIYAARHPQIEAVHVEIDRPFWVKLLGKSLPIRGWDLHAWRYYWLNRLRIGSWLPRFVGDENIDVIYSMTAWVGWAAADLRQTQNRPRLAVHIDATEPASVRDFGYPRLASCLAARAERRVLGAADRLFSFSHWSANSASNDCGVPADRVSVIPPSVAAGPEKPHQDQKLAQIIFIGNDWDRKGGPALLEIHQQRLADRAVLHIVSARAPVDHAAQNVVWHGTVANQVLLEELLPAMDLLAMPTREDTFLWAGLEAAACGVPSLVPRLAGIPDVVLDGQTGVLTPHRDDMAFAAALDQLVDNRQLLRRYGQAARAHAIQNFNPDVNYPRLMDALVDLAKK